jgi:SAM-dependent methyltransferase
MDNVSPEGGAEGGTNTFSRHGGPREGDTRLICPCCGGSVFQSYVRDIRSIYSAKPYDVFQCQQCRHGMSVPVPSEAELKAIYDRIYSYDVHRAVMGEKAYRGRLLAGQIARLRPAHGDFRVLEIGCMFGVLLNELAARGITAQGIELSAEPVRHCQSEGLNVSCESVEQFVARAHSERFEVIVLSHVLEHIRDPRAIIQQLAGLLTHGGHLVVSVPNHRCSLAKLAGRNWGWWQVPVHLNHFCEESARRFFESLGFDAVSTNLRGGDSLTILLTMMNALGANKGEGVGTLTPTKRAVVTVLSKLLRGYARVGSDELTVVCGPVPELSPNHGIGAGMRNVYQRSSTTE